MPASTAALHPSRPSVAPQRETPGQPRASGIFGRIKTFASDIRNRITAAAYDNLADAMHENRENPKPLRVEEGRLDEVMEQIGTLPRESMHREVSPETQSVERKVFLRVKRNSEEHRRLMQKVTAGETIAAGEHRFSVRRLDRTLGDEELQYVPQAETAAWRLSTPHWMKGLVEGVEGAKKARKKANLTISDERIAKLNPEQARILESFLRDDEIRGHIKTDALVTVMGQLRFLKEERKRLGDKGGET